MSEGAPRQKYNEYREVAERLSSYLLQAKQVTLSPNESLELVTKLFGLENAELSDVACPVQRDLLADAYASRLSTFYSTSSGGNDEHPLYTEEEWHIAGGTDVEGPLAYWRWVARSIEADQAMWPWDLESEPAVLIAKAARIKIEHFGGKGWVPVGEGAVLVSQESCASELQGWQLAACKVLELPGILEAYSAEETLSLPPTVIAFLVSKQVAPLLQRLHAKSQDATLRLEGSMRPAERAGSIWVRFAKAAGVSVHQEGMGAWVVTKGPAIKELSRIPLCKTEAAAWREAAACLIQHLRMRMDISTLKWQLKTPTQQLELIQTFYASSRPSDPEFAFEQLFIQSAKALCRGIGWKVTKGKLQIGSKNEVWHLNQDESYSSEPLAWLSGAEQIRKRTQELAKLSYLEWVALSLDDQILLAQEHLL
jgi:hypothetical protein